MEMLFFSPRLLFFFVSTILAQIKCPQSPVRHVISSIHVSGPGVLVVSDAGKDQEKMSLD